jgi:hypothetical protein
MKIKRTKTGTKTSDSKHEIVKTEQNGILAGEDSAQILNSKKQMNVIGVPASPTSSANKRGNNSHRKDKVVVNEIDRRNLYRKCMFCFTGKGKSYCQRKIGKSSRAPA